MTTNQRQPCIVPKPMAWRSHAVVDGVPHHGRQSSEKRKSAETSGVKAVLDEAAGRIEATWREKLLRETADLRTENALLMAQVDEFSSKLAEATDRNEKIEADCNERVAFIEEKFELDTASLELENNRAPCRERQISRRCSGTRQAGRPTPCRGRGHGR